MMLIYNYDTQKCIKLIVLTKSLLIRLLKRFKLIIEYIEYVFVNYILKVIYITTTIVWKRM